MTMEMLRSLERTDAPAGAGVPVMRVDSDHDAAGVIAWFAGDRSRSHVRLVIGGQPAGVLERRVLLQAVPPRVLGTGDAGRLELPGEVSTRTWEFVDLECPQAGCPESPVVAPAFDPADPPRCRVHPTLALRRRG